MLKINRNTAIERTEGILVAHVRSFQIEEGLNLAKEDLWEADPPAITLYENYIDRPGAAAFWFSSWKVNV